MNEPVISSMKEFVHSEIGKIKTEHEKMVSGWKSVNLTEENIRHLYSLFKRCSKQEIRMFEENNFLGENDTEEIQTLITKKLIRVDENNKEVHKAKEKKTPEKTGTKKNQQKKKNNTSGNKKSTSKSASSTDSTQHGDSKLATDVEEETARESETENSTEVEKSEEADASSEQAVTSPEVMDSLVSQQPESLLATDNTNKADEEVGDQVVPITVATELPSGNQVSNSDVMSKKSKNPFDNDHLFIEPLLSCTSNTKDTDEPDEFSIALPNHYMSQESNALKSNLQKLATDISTEEQQIRARMETGEPAVINQEMLEDFISRANTVLKETEAVTVRKIAEAETKKFLTSLKVPTGNSLETISNELMQDIWPKSNKWRCLAREDQQDEEIDLKTKKKQEEQIERDVRAAIKSAGEPLNKKQIGQIRKAAIVYRDFDFQEKKELDFRSDHTLKLVELVSAYEASNRMDELIRLRLAIAFCTKRRDYFLKVRPPNFMQFSYMYIYLLEKINAKTASICACLNYQSTVGSDFDELEELMLNLFHEDYFLEKN